ncbi:hypothetical protein D3C85_1313070 [compost metagenome]
MIQHGNPPYLECSMAGDSRFSAFGAKITGRPIEHYYQAAKEFEDGSTGLSWREAKGRKAVNAEEVSRLYEDLWRLYMKLNPELYEVLAAASGLSDKYGQKGHNCQATTLWKLRCEYMAGIEY